MTDDALDPSLLAFLRTLTPDSSAAPRLDREPTKRPDGEIDYTAEPLPLVFVPEDNRPSPNPADHDPAAVATWQHVQALGKRDTATGDITHGRGFIGVREDGTKAPGALPWWWCYGHQPVHVRGAVYAESHEAARLVHGITEAQAEKLMMHDLATAIFSGDIRFDMTPRIAREAAKRR